MFLKTECAAVVGGVVEDVRTGQNKTKNVALTQRGKDGGDERAGDLNNCRGIGHMLCLNLGKFGHIGPSIGWTNNHVGFATMTHLHYTLTTLAFFLSFCVLTRVSVPHSLPFFPCPNHI